MSVEPSPATPDQKELSEQALPLQPRCRVPLRRFMKAISQDVVLLLLLAWAVLMLKLVLKLFP